MQILLDTHTFLWIIEGKNLSLNAKQAFLDSENQIYFSVVSYWEICIKYSLGKLELVPNWPQLFDKEIEINGIQWLAIEKEHSLGIINLAMLHRDPFDRLLIAQARAEGLTILTSDSQIKNYDVATLW